MVKVIFITILFLQSVYCWGQFRLGWKEGEIRNVHSKLNEYPTVRYTPYNFRYLTYSYDNGELLYYFDSSGECYMSTMNLDLLNQEDLVRLRKFIADYNNEYIIIEQNKKWKSVADGITTLIELTYPDRKVNFNYTIVRDYMSY